MIKRYLRWTLLGLVIVLTASVNLMCVVVDNDDDGDPTTGVVIEFTAVQGKRVQVVNNLLHLHSKLASKMFRKRVFHAQNIERSDNLNPTSDFFNLTDLLSSPLRC
jgi:hypothetical protein